MQPGVQLGGRYTLEQKITSSGMAEVWVARQQVGGGMSKSVVIKMIHPDLNAQQEARQRFFDEARFMAQIHHANVVQFYDFGEEGDDLLFQVMEYIEGFAVEQIVAKSRDISQPIPLPIVCRLIADACGGLGYIHDLRDAQGRNMELVHRDISPQNLLIAKSGTIKIIDFGIVKAREKSSRTRTGVIVGKLQYMSPEQLSSEDLDRRSDIYSLGLVLYELLTLERRFRGSNLLEVFYEALNEPPPAVRDMRPDCPPELVQCVQTALAQDKDHRYSSAYQMQEVLESYLHHQNAAVGERQVAAFLDELFGDAEELTEHTTQIHAFSLLGGEFNDDVGEETVAALASDLLHGNKVEAESTFRAGVGFEATGSYKGRYEPTSPSHSFGGTDGHTLSPRSSLAGYSEGIDDHTLSSMASVGVDHGTIETATPPHARRGHTMDRSSIEPTRIQSASALHAEAAASGMPDYYPPPPQPAPSSPKASEAHQASVMISPALMEEAGGDIRTYSSKQGSSQASPKSAEPAASKARPSKPSPPKKSGGGLSSQTLLIIGLGVGAFVLGVLMVVILTSR